MAEVYGNESWFNDDVKFYKDVYVYGNLYYDFDGLGDNLILDHLEAKTLKITGISTFVGDVNFDVITGNKVGVTTVDADNIVVRDKLELTNDNGTNYLNAFASGAYAGRVGINTDEPTELLDVNGDIRLQNHIYDSSNNKGSGFGYYLSQDANGIRWVFVPPDALSEGFFIQNEGQNVGVGSYTTLNFIGNTGGGDIINAVENSGNSKIVDITVISHWLSNSSGLGTSGSVGIGSTQPTAKLDVVGDARIVGILTSNNIVVTGITTTKNLLVTGITTLGVTTASSLLVTGITTLGVTTASSLGSSSLLVTGITTLGVTTASSLGSSSLLVTGITTLGVTTASSLLVTGITTLGVTTASSLGSSSLQVTGITTLGVTTASSLGSSSLLVTGITTLGVTTASSLLVTGITTLGVTTASSLGSSSLLVTGITTLGVTTASSLLVTGITTLGVTTASSLGSSSLQVTGITTLGVTTASSLKVTGLSTFVGVGTFESDLNVGRNFEVAGLSTFIGSVTFKGGTINLGDANDDNVVFNADVDSHLIPNTDDTYDLGSSSQEWRDLYLDGTANLDDVKITGALYDGNDSTASGETDYRLASIGTGVTWRPAGVETKNILYVTKDGNDSNSGLLEGDAKATIGGAAAVALDGDTIYVRPGTYFENNPIGLRTDVSISGQDLRLVTVVPNNPTEDLFHVRRGCLIENMNFAGNNVSIAHTGAAMVAFPPTGSATQNSGYVAAGPANEGPSGRYRSPYVRNCTNFATGSIGMRVDGNHVNAAYTGTNNLGQDLKSMVVDSYTQYNQNGVGVSITNKAYAQLVSIFTINCDIAIYASSGGQCDLTNSNSSFGNYGLYADGTSGDEFTGITTVAADPESDTFTFADIRDSESNVRKPFDGQGAFFRLNLDSYPDTGTKTGIVTEPLRTIRSITVTNPGSGYTSTNPPIVTIDSPLGPESIDAELSANVSATGSVTSIDVISSGRNFLPAGSGSNQQNIGITIAAPASGTTATADAVTDPILFTVASSTEPTTSTGIGTITFNEFVPYSVGVGTSVAFRRLSRIITSSHSFEYVGAGTDINRANPFQGGVTIPENEVVAINGGQVPFTSTDQKGNFKIGQGLTIDQTTSTISGRDFNRAIQANLTPLIIALGG
jgi:hypothetical protein